LKPAPLTEKEACKRVARSVVRGDARLQRTEAEFTTGIRRVVIIRVAAPEIKTNLQIMLTFDNRHVVQ
jgi:hypothetical protein